MFSQLEKLDTIYKYGLLIVMNSGNKIIYNEAINECYLIKILS